ncbi:hypothetical protein [Bacillus phage phiAGATE]|uniref:Uncharacterized protein n=1 Tax=Bacillus phage phiAGATE TaxID=1204533 RepID=L0LC12_9CAUD|nr:hypothetical protein G380_gp065 [Bacillus phage phiAGATE]AGB62715.1 hypothetical protein [Bacillus phage phiAGATE]
MRKYSGKWTYNTSEDDAWHFYDQDMFDTKEEAIAAGKREFEEHWADISGFYVGQAEEIGISFPYIDADSVLETFADSVYDDVGEVAEGYLQDVSDDDLNGLQYALSVALRKWLIEKKHEPDFYHMNNIEFVPLKPEMWKREPS